MTFNDIFGNGFPDGIAQPLEPARIITALLITALLGIYIFFCYRTLTRRTFYSAGFASSLVLLAVTTAAIILSIQSSVVISLGMVGALSIVRFRTAIKEPMDLVFLFWSISIGIICGAGIYLLALIFSLLATVLLVFLQWIPAAKAPMILVVNGSAEGETGERVLSAVKEFDSHFREKSRSITDGTLELVLELRTDEQSALCNAVSSIGGVTHVSLLAHDGEVTF